MATTSPAPFPESGQRKLSVREAMKRAKDAKPLGNKASEAQWEYETNACIEAAKRRGKWAGSGCRASASPPWKSMLPTR